MNILIIGYGSIGKRHFQILNTLKEKYTISNIDIVSKQAIPNETSYNNLEDIEELNKYNYFIIANETSLHYSKLEYLCNNVKNKVILVEKPLFSTLKNTQRFHNNQIFVAYNLRFHPLIEKVKELLKNKTTYYANIFAAQYLPTWRPNTDYKKCYSANIKQGGGVLRDLSHELDYINFLFGTLKEVNSINVKTSTLEINSDDIYTAIGFTEQNTIVNVTLDYISKTPIRRIIIHCEDETIEINIIKNELLITDKNSNTVKFKPDPIDRNYTYLHMHQAILEKKYTQLCNYQEGRDIVSIIDQSDYKELNHE